MKIHPPGTPERRAQDREMILTPDNWPIWPNLPLKRVGKWEHGFLKNTSLSDDTVEMRVYLGTVFGGPGGSFVDYEDVDALLDDKWTVD